MESESLNQKSIDYYDMNAETFIDSTINADVSSLYSHFEKYITVGNRILDLGCGSGRDSFYFLKKGYEVIAMDPSMEMCKQVRENSSIITYMMTAEKMKFVNEFHAVWACASLIHVSRDNQFKVLKKISRALKNKGIFYGSWKYGESDREEGGRFFTDYTEEKLKQLVKGIEEFEIVELWKTDDVRESKKTQSWVNIILRKVSNEKISSY